MIVRAGNLPLYGEMVHDGEMVHVPFSSLPHSVRLCDCWVVLTRAVAHGEEPVQPRTLFVAIQLFS